MHKSWNSDKVSKIYIALVNGTVPKGLTAIRSNLKIERHNKIRKSDMTDEANGKRSETVILSNIPISKHYTLLKLSLKTGRMHQIRAQFSHIGHPLLCDEVYGNSHLNDRCKTWLDQNVFALFIIEVGTWKISVVC